MSELNAREHLEVSGEGLEVALKAAMIGEPRQDVVNTAVAFLLNPRVQQISADDKRAFLVKKGLSSGEIDIAMARSLSLSPTPQLNARGLLKPRSFLDNLSQAAMGIAIFSSVLYGLHWLFKTYVEPYWIKSEQQKANLEESVESLATAVSGLSSKLELTAENNQDIVRTLKDLRHDMAALKAMFLARNQFASPPLTNTTTPSIPAWQRNHTSFPVLSNFSQKISPLPQTPVHFKEDPLNETKQDVKIVLPQDYSAQSFSTLRGDKSTEGVRQLDNEGEDI